ncbi:MAG: chromate efflux transporter [Porphyrobacter sp.]|jgi:chromate transporter|nr:chromate efflux transporter [Porphyrobacter sp.]
MATAAPTTSVPFSDLVSAFARIGLVSFGGPAGQIALMHREVVEERGWIAEEDYLHALNFCHLLPGPEAQQLATWIGWRLHGWKGGLTAGLLFILPGVAIILALSMLYAVAAELAWLKALFVGVKAAVLVIVVQALLRIAGRALDTRLKQGLALGAFAALFLFDLPFPLVVLGAGAIGVMAAALRPQWLAIKPSGHGLDQPPRPWRSTASSIIICGALWAAPMVLIAVTLGRDHVLWDIGAFFAQLALVTFGGAYAVLAYMAQEAVQGFGWLRPGEMADGLGLAESTPGPLILVTQFVGYLAAFRAPDPFNPLVAGVLGAMLTTWVSFAPCFMWIFALAPWIDRLGGNLRLKGGLAALTAAVVGVIANLTAWFGLHVFFGTVNTRQSGPLRLLVPDLQTVDVRAIALVLLACLLAFGLRFPIIRLLVMTAAAGLALMLAG